MTNEGIVVNFYSGWEGLICFDLVSRIDEPRSPNNHLLMPPRAVMDTNILLAGLRSRNGAAFELLRLWRSGKWKLVLSNTVLFEYDEVIKRNAAVLNLTLADTDALLEVICFLAEPWNTSERWRPVLADPSDEAFAQLAFESKADCLVTHNLRHFTPAEAAGIKVLAPRVFLDIVRASR